MIKEDETKRRNPIKYGVCAVCGDTFREECAHEGRYCCRECRDVDSLLRDDEQKKRIDKITGE